MNYSINWLTEQIKNGIHPDYLFFWGHTQKTAGITDKSCFSQWWPSPFTMDEITYPTAEHWMMANKALLFEDEEQYQNITTTASPGEVKKFGRAVKNFDAGIWDLKAYELVVAGNLHKFSQNKALSTFLVNTRKLVIVEASPVDKIWGIGTNAHETDPSKWNGLNLLGFALMEVRDQLKK
ncbi:MAG: hypothetical protein JWP81_3282 [Ferruginibacter sp.]|nr:hypothetical protein [Ferruginibacter sp.]